MSSQVKKDRNELKKVTLISSIWLENGQIWSNSTKFEVEYDQI